MDYIGHITSAQSSSYYSLPMWMLGMDLKKRGGQPDKVCADKALKNKFLADVAA